MGCLGILGGVGPLASARFLGSIYRAAEANLEQEAPRVILASDPSFPDRTANLLRGERKILIQKTEEQIALLLTAGATHIVICCFTLHEILQEVNAKLRKTVISLPNL